MQTDARTASTVLVVDDDAEIREVLATMLHEEGYPVRTAMNGRDALGLLERMERPGLILLDLTMPIMDGNGFLEELTAAGQAEPIPVVICSAVAHRATQSGAAGVIDKPIDFERLLGFVRRYCGEALQPV